MEKVPTVYIIASRRHGTLYIGVTSDLCTRIYDHKAGTYSGFSKKYGCKTLVWHQAFSTMTDAINREKQLKEWKRGWKIELIEKMNPTWDDLFESVCGPFIPDPDRPPPW